MQPKKKRQTRGPTGLCELFSRRLRPMQTLAGVLTLNSLGKFSNYATDRATRAATERRKIAVAARQRLAGRTAVRSLRLWYRHIYHHGCSNHMMTAPCTNSIGTRTGILSQDSSPVANNSCCYCPCGPPATKLPGICGSSISFPWARAGPTAIASRIRFEQTNSRQCEMFFILTWSYMSYASYMKRRKKIKSHKQTRNEQ